MDPDRGRTPLRVAASLIAALTLSFITPSALAQPPVAELTVIAYGAQRVDLASGRTVLEDGGELVERRSGVRLTAAWIGYLEGVEVVAREVRFEGDFGRVEAGELVIDLVNVHLWADGGVVLQHEALALAATSLWLAVDSGVVGLVGEVEALVPEASASEAWIELATGRVLLLGPYRFADGPLVLTGNVDAILQLDAVELVDGVAYDARSTVDDALAQVVTRARDQLRAGRGE